MAEAQDGDVTAGAPRPRGAGRRRIPGPWRRGWIVAALGLLTAAVLVLHAHVPNSPGNAGSLLETVLPWVGLAVVPLAACAALRRSGTAAVALLVPVAVWLVMFGGLLMPGRGGGPHNLTVVTHNVDAQNPDARATARDLLRAKADLVALEEITPDALPDYRAVLDGTYRHVYKRGTVALFSKYPIEHAAGVNIRMGWPRALRAQVDGPDGPMAVYVVHLASVRVGRSGFTAGQRDATIQALGEEIAKEPLTKVVLMGDLNGSANDRSLAPVVGPLRSAQGAAGSGFGFSWPAGFPMARIDHILVRGVTPEHAWTLPATGSDHLPVAARLQV